MDLKQCIKKIEEKYDLGIKLDEIYADEICRYVKTKLVDFGRVGIFCAGKHTKHFLNDMKDELPIDYIIENDGEKVGKNLLGIPIVSVAEIRQDDIIIIGTYDYRKEIQVQLKQLGMRQKNIIDIYDFLENNGIVPWSDYYTLNNNIYVPLVLLNNEFKSSCIEVEKERINLLLIKAFFAIKDFPSLNKYIHIYEEHKFKNYRNYICLNMEMEELFEKVKSIIQNRIGKDIVWFWQDALLYKWACEMPFYRKSISKGMWFTNAYSSTVWTRCVYELIFNKQYEIDDRSFLHLKKGNYSIVNKLQKRGYRCVKIYGQTPIEMEKMDFANDPLVSYEIATSSTYWEGVNCLLQEDSPIFLLLHTAIEAHQPNCCPFLDEYSSQWSDLSLRCNKEINNKYIKNVRACCNYLDGVTGFYADLLGDHCNKIFMSDHGSIQSGDEMRWMENANHMFFLITGVGIKQKICEEMFCLENFEEVIEYIIEPSEKKWRKIFLEEVKLQSVDVYNAYVIDSMIKNAQYKYCISFRGIQTKNDKYILMKDGEEVYCIDGNEDENYIDSSAYKDRIDYLRTKTGNQFISSDEEKFKYTKKLYDYISDLKVSNDKWCRH